MNREDRRKNKITTKEAEYRLKMSDIEKIKADATKEAAKQAFLYMVALPLLVLRDRFGFGKTRCERFYEAVSALLDCYNDGYLTVEDIRETLEKELEITIWMEGKA